MHYTEAIQYLENEVGFASIPGLSRIQALLQRLGNPQDHLQYIHIAGTNGKGSAAAMLTNILQQNGYHVGRYTSPHLARYNERITINQKEISDVDFAEVISLMRIHCDAMRSDGEDVPTLFEILTAAAFQYFAEHNVDIVVLEVGLGGTYDATNVISSSLLSLIMSISIDHTDFLGNTLEEIASEKCGIIKKNCPVVLYSQEKNVYNIAEAKAKQQHAPLYYVSNSHVTIHKQDFSGTCFSVENDLITYNNIMLPLLGDYQIQNCITVLEACTILKQYGLHLEDADIRYAIAHTTWAGRMEILNQNPIVLLDGAHNTDGITQLASTLPTYAQERKITLLLGVLGDKEYQLMLSKIFPLVSCAVLTEPQSHRKLDADILKQVAVSYGKPLMIETDIAKAYEIAYAHTAQQDMIVCCGSLYMIGALRNYIIEKTGGIKSC